MIRRSRHAAKTGPELSHSETIPLRPSSDRTKAEPSADWSSCALFCLLMIFAFGGTGIVVLLTEHATELPDGHTLFHEHERKVSTERELQGRINRVHRNIGSTEGEEKDIKLDTEGNDNLLDLGRVPKKSDIAPHKEALHDNFFDDWFFGGNKNKDQKNIRGSGDQKDRWAQDDHHDEMKKLFPHLYDENGDNGEKKIRHDPWADLFGGKKDGKNPWGSLFGNHDDDDGDDHPFANLFGSPKKKVDPKPTQKIEENQMGRPNTFGQKEPTMNQNNNVNSPNNQANPNSQPGNYQPNNQPTHTQPIYNNQPPKNPPTYNNQTPKNPPIYNNQQPNSQPIYNTQPTYNNQPPNTQPMYNNQPPTNNQPPVYNTQTPNNQPIYNNQPLTNNQPPANNNQNQPTYKNNQNQPTHNNNQNQPTYNNQPPQF